MIELFANSGDPVASDLGLHCLPVTIIGVSRLQWVSNLRSCARQNIFIVHLFYLGFTSLSTIFQSYRNGVWMTGSSMLTFTEISRPRHRT